MNEIQTKGASKDLHASSPTDAHLMSRRDEAAQARATSVQNLQTLYAVVMGLALSIALENVFVGDGGKLVFRSRSLVLLGALLVTMVPFFHGALRHLDHTWVARAGRDLRKGALLLDFGILLVEGCLFLALARMLDSPVTFIWVLGTLLLVDVGWATLAQFAFSQEGAERAELKWIQNNLVTAVILALVVVTMRTAAASVPLSNTFLSVLVLAVTTIRTIVDYYRSWEFYYPGAAIGTPLTETPQK